jgi:RND family efflux transporter MFP subunit
MTNRPVGYRSTLLRSVVLVRAVITSLAFFINACSPGSDAKARPHEVAPGSDNPTTRVTDREHLEQENKPTHGTGGEEAGTRASLRVTLSEAGYQTAQIAVESPRVEPSALAGAGLEVAGQVELDPARVALISPRTAGRVERLLVVPGDRVRAGETVALLYSPAYITAQADLIQALRRAATLTGTGDAEGAQALASAARRRLQLLGVAEESIAALQNSGSPSDLLHVVAPFDGSVLERQALAGTAVEVGSPLFTIADLSAVNAAAAIPEHALRNVRIGQKASIQVSSYPERRFAGQVTRLSDQIDSTRRTAKALIRIANPERLLKPGMFATVVLDEPARAPTGNRGKPGAPSSALSVPATAVLSDTEERYVFVQVGPRSFERRPIEVVTGTASVMGGERILVVSGLVPNELVVTRGAFILKSELAKSSFAEDEH